MKPKYTVWKRRRGGYRKCPKRGCEHRHPEVVTVGGKTFRPKVCVECGGKLPARLTYPRGSPTTWFLREFVPETGKIKDLRVAKLGYANSMEGARGAIRHREQTYTASPVQAELIELTTTLCKQVDAPDRDAAIDTLIRKLGGDPARRQLKPVAWTEAVEIIASEMRDVGCCARHVEKVTRLGDYLHSITSLENWNDVDADAIAIFRAKRLAGGWLHGGRPMKAVQPSSVNNEMVILHGFLERAVAKSWVARNVMGRYKRWACRTTKPRVAYMTDAEFKRLIEACDSVWLRAFMVIAYYTAARRSDLLRLQWERDIDLDGSRVAHEGRSGPHIYLHSGKSDTPHWIPLHPAAVAVLRELRAVPVVDSHVFAARLMGRRIVERASAVTRAFRQACERAGLVKTCERNGKTITRPWTPHDLRRKANTDLRNGGASPKERSALLGHRTVSVNQEHYEALLPGRERSLIDGLPAFGLTA